MLGKTEGLTIDLLERVLMKLGLSDRPAPTLDGLQTLTQEEKDKILWQNLERLLGL